MSYYDLFSSRYDQSVSKYYIKQRKAAIESLSVSKGDVVLDFPCGTGLSFDGLLAKGAGGVIGGDLSKGMLRQASQKIKSKSLNNTRVYAADAKSVCLDDLELAEQVDRLFICLGLTCFNDWEEAFANLWQLLKPGGRCTIMDIHAPKRGFYGLMAIFAAQADVRRRFWEPLQERAQDFEKIEQPSLPLHGGTIYIASGNKPR